METIDYFSPGFLGPKIFFKLKWSKAFSIHMKDWWMQKKKISYKYNFTLNFILFLFQHLTVGKEYHPPDNISVGVPFLWKLKHIKTWRCLLGFFLNERHEYVFSVLGSDQNVFSVGLLKCPKSSAKALNQQFDINIHFLATVNKLFLLIGMKCFYKRSKFH